MAKESLLSGHLLCTDLRILNKTITGSVYYLARVIDGRRYEGTWIMNIRTVPNTLDNNPAMSHLETFYAQSFTMSVICCSFASPLVDRLIDWQMVRVTRRQTQLLRSCCRATDTFVLPGSRFLRYDAITIFRYCTRDGKKKKRWTQFHPRKKWSPGVERVDKLLLSP